MKLLSYKHYQLRTGWIYGLKQNPIDTDFHITPCLTFGHYIGAPDEPRVYGIGLEWGYWAVTIAIFILGWMKKR